MEPPFKRLRTHDPDDFDNFEVLERARANNDQRLKSRFESIFEKYQYDFSEVGDEIDLETGEIVVDNGHLRGLLGGESADVGSASGFLKAISVPPGQEHGFANDDEDSDEDNGEDDDFDASDDEPGGDPYQNEGVSDDVDDENEEDMEDGQEVDESGDGVEAVENQSAANEVGGEGRRIAHPDPNDQATILDSIEEGVSAHSDTRASSEGKYSSLDDSENSRLPSEAEIIRQFGPEIGAKVAQYVANLSREDDLGVDSLWKAPPLTGPLPAAVFPKMTREKMRSAPAERDEIWSSRPSGRPKKRSRVDPSHLELILGRHFKEPQDTDRVYDIAAATAETNNTPRSVRSLMNGEGNFEGLSPRNMDRRQGVAIESDSALHHTGSSAVCQRRSSPDKAAVLHQTTETGRPYESTVLPLSQAESSPLSYASPLSQEASFNRKALQRFNSEDDRLIVQLREQKMTWRDIAARLQRLPPAVHARYRRLMARKNEERSRSGFKGSDRVSPISQGTDSANSVGQGKDRVNPTSKDRFPANSAGQGKDRVKSTSKDKDPAISAGRGQDIVDSTSKSQDHADLLGQDEGRLTIKDNCPAIPVGPNKDRLNSTSKDKFPANAAAQGKERIDSTSKNQDPANPIGQDEDKLNSTSKGKCLARSVSHTPDQDTGSIHNSSALNESPAAPDRSQVSSRPTRRPFTREEDEQIRELRDVQGLRWSDIARHMSGFSTKALYTRHRLLVSMERKSLLSKSENDSPRQINPPAAKSTAVDDIGRSRKKRPRYQSFSKEDDEFIIDLKENKGLSWAKIGQHFPRRSPGSIQARYAVYLKSQPRQPNTPYSINEDRLLLQLKSLGMIWEDMVKYFPRRNARSLHVRWYKHLARDGIELEKSNLLLTSSSPKKRGASDSAGPPAQGRTLTGSINQKTHSLITNAANVSGLPANESTPITNETTQNLASQIPEPTPSDARLQGFTTLSPAHSSVETSEKAATNLPDPLSSKNSHHSSPPARKLPSALKFQSQTPAQIIPDSQDSPSENEDYSSQNPQDSLSDDEDILQTPTKEHISSAPKYFLSPVAQKPSPYRSQSRHLTPAQPFKSSPLRPSHRPRPAPVTRRQSYHSSPLRPHLPSPAISHQRAKAPSSSQSSPLLPGQPQALENGQIPKSMPQRVKSPVNRIPILSNTPTLSFQPSQPSETPPLSRTIPQPVASQTAPQSRPQVIDLTTSSPPPHPGDAPKVPHARARSPLRPPSWSQERERLQPRQSSKSMEGDESETSNELERERDMSKSRSSSPIDLLMPDYYFPSEEQQGGN
ncbi:MAG: hypothetical protein M1819_001880 [Sarea resinae]|nr:MAG: hypothetical protein M1819_001880 [Sarea resinae]